MEKYINVATGEVKVCEEVGVLKSTAIGSCVVIAACDYQKHLGIMAHIMLPGCAPSNNYDESTRYAVDAISKMIKIVSLKGANLCDFEVCLVGGANVLKKHNDTICEKNIESVTRLLKEKNIPVKAAILGGTERKGISLNIKNGSFYFTEGETKRKLLWKSA